MRILITGSKGQLGSEINTLALNNKANVMFFADLPELDITNKSGLGKYIHKNNIEAIINCAAYTNVDKSEDDSICAMSVNATAVQNLVELTQEYNLKLIHISTDYVFNGNSHIPYKEDDEVSPIGVYGKTKRAGEEFILKSSSESIIIRTSWLYSSFGNNFVKTMLRLGEERDSLGVIFDQVGTPTYARDLALACLELLYKSYKLNDKGKIYHFSNEGIISWYDFAKAIMEIANINCYVKPIETKDYPTIAKRPNYSVLNKAKIKNDFSIKIPYWKDSLAECLELLQHKTEVQG